MFKRVRAFSGLFLCTALTVNASLIGTYTFTSDASALSLDPNISSFSAFNNNTAVGGVTGSVNIGVPGYYHTATAWDTTFNKFVQFTVTPVSGYYIAVNTVTMNVRQNDANSTTTMR